MANGEKCREPEDTVTTGATGRGAAGRGRGRRALAGPAPGSPGRRARPAPVPVTGVAGVAGPRGRRGPAAAGRPRGTAAARRSGSPPLLPDVVRALTRTR